MNDDRRILSRDKYKMLKRMSFLLTNLKIPYQYDYEEINPFLRRIRNYRD